MIRRAVAVPLCVLAVAAAGCGADSAKQALENGVDPVAQAASNTTKAGTVGVVMKGSVTTAQGKIPLDATGAFDLGANRGSLKLRSTVPVLGRLTLEERVDGQTIYLRSNALASLLPAGRSWVKLDLAELAAKRGVDLSGLSQLGAGSDPTQFLKFLTVAGTPKKVGSESIDGTATTRYHLDIDLAKLAKASGHPQLQKAVEQLRKVTDVSTIPTDVWVDAQQRVRRQQVSYAVTKPAKVALDLVVDYRDFGKPVSVTVPDASETTDLASLLNLSTLLGK